MLDLLKQLHDRFIAGRGEQEALSAHRRMLRHLERAKADGRFDLISGFDSAELCLPTATRNGWRANLLVAGQGCIGALLLTHRGDAHYGFFARSLGGVTGELGQGRRDV